MRACSRLKRYCACSSLSTELLLQPGSLGLSATTRAPSCQAAQNVKLYNCKQTILYVCKGLRTRVLLSSIFFMADSVVRGNFTIWNASSFWVGGALQATNISQHNCKNI